MKHSQLCTLLRPKILTSGTIFAVKEFFTLLELRCLAASFVKVSSFLGSTHFLHVQIPEDSESANEKKIDLGDTFILSFH